MAPGLQPMVPILQNDLECEQIPKNFKRPCCHPTPPPILMSKLTKLIKTIQSYCAPLQGYYGKWFQWYHLMLKERIIQPKKVTLLVTKSQYPRHKRPSLLPSR